MTTNPVVSKYLVDKLEEWLDELLTESEDLAKYSTLHIDMFKERLNGKIIKNLIYTPQTFEPLQIQFSNGNNRHFIRHFNKLNNLLFEIHKLHMIGEVRTADIREYHSNIFEDARVCIHTTVKPLSFCKRDRENGRYMSEVFIDKIRLYKSVQDCYNTEIYHP